MDRPPIKVETMTGEQFAEEGMTDCHILSRMDRHIHDILKCFRGPYQLVLSMAGSTKKTEFHNMFNYDCCRRPYHEVRNYFHDRLYPSKKGEARNLKAVLSLW